jgi:hypothetical protein
MPEIRDVLGASDNNAIAKIKKIVSWVNSLPISSLPFVDMGFDTLSPEIIDSINQQRDNIVNNYQSIQLQTKQTEFMQSKVLFVPRFPFWTPLYSESSPDRFIVGERVINLNGSKRAYIPFGQRGTVIGKTGSKVIVMFDEQFLQGSDINGHCEQYRGAIMESSHLLNLTKKFNAQLKKNNYQLID